MINKQWILCCNCFLLATPKKIVDDLFNHGMLGIRGDKSKINSVYSPDYLFASRVYGCLKHSNGTRKRSIFHEKNKTKEKTRFRLEGLFFPLHSLSKFKAPWLKCELSAQGK